MFDNGEAIQGPKPSERYGDYEVIKPLAAGGMAEIFLAKKIGAQGFKRMVVVKRIRREMVTDQHLIDLFIDEAHIAAKLDHPNVVVTTDLGELDNSYFMAMEYLRGQTLRNLQKRVAEHGMVLPPHFWVRVMEYALDGLHYAHELRNDDGSLMGLVHRDFTPSNIMITYAGTVKVIDFGVAHVEGPTRHETRIGTLKGKIAYMSPEQCRGTTVVDRKTDVFAAGIVLWELLSGRQLFDGPSDTAILVEIIQGTIPEPTWNGQPVDRELNDIVMRALDRDLEKRFQTAAELRDALRDYLRNIGARVDASDISAAMSQFFAEERIADENLAGGTGAHSNPTGKRGESISRSGAGSRPSQVSRTGHVRGQQATNPSLAGQTNAPPASNKRGLMIAIGFLGVVLGVGIWRFAPRGPSGPGPQPPISTPIAQNPPAQNPPVAQNPPAQNPPAQNPPVAQNPPAQNPPAQNPPVAQNPPAQNPPAQNPPVAQNPPAQNPPAQNPPVAQNPPAQNPPVAAQNPTPPNHPKKDPGKESAPSSSGSGLLDFDTRPYTAVYLGKKKIGDTPLLGVKVPAGHLTFTLVNDEAGIKETFSIDVPKDGHVFKKLKLN